MDKLREWIISHINARNGVILLLAVLVLAFWGGSAYRDWQAENGGLQLADVDTGAESTDADAESTESVSTGEVAVHVTGAVSSPGVYTLDADARVDDAVRLANPTAEADLDQLNLAQHLTDGMKIIVPTAGETATSTTTAGTESTTVSATDSAGRVNINTATAEDLEALPNIGETRAKAIIAYREENGPFSAPEDIKKVSGIGDKIYESLADQITAS